MTNLNQNISSVFSATQLILVFVAILFNIYYFKIQKNINKKIPLDEDEHEKYLNYLDSLKPMSNLLLILFVSLFLIFFLPILIQIAIQSFSQIYSNFNPINWYDITRISFLFIALLIFIFIYLTYQMDKQLKDRLNHVKDKLRKKKENS